MNNEGNDEGPRDPRIKKNRGRMSNMDAMMEDGMINPIIDSGNFLGQKFGSVGFMKRMDIGSMPGMGMGHTG